MQIILYHPWNKWYPPPLCPRVAKAILPTISLAFVITAYPRLPTLPEYMVYKLWTQSHCGPPEDVPPEPQTAHVPLLAVQQPSQPSRGLHLTTFTGIIPHYLIVWGTGLLKVSHVWLQHTYAWFQLFFSHLWSSCTWAASRRAMSILAFRG